MCVFTFMELIQVLLYPAFCKQHIGYDELAFKYYIKDVTAASKWILSIEYHLKVCYEIKINLLAYTLPDVLFVD